MKLDLILEYHRIKRDEWWEIMDEVSIVSFNQFA